MRPYKLNLKNNVALFILALLEIVSVELFLARYHSATSIFPYVVLGSTLLLGVPHMVLIFYICYVLAEKAGITQYLIKKYKTLQDYVLPTKHTSQARADVEAGSDIGSLPDRLINPADYEPVLCIREEQTSDAQTTESKDQVSEEPRRLTPVYTYGSIN